MNNPSLNCDKLFRKQVEICLIILFHKKTMETIRYCIRKKNTCVIAIIMFYENNGEKPKKVYKVLSCVIYYLI